MSPETMDDPNTPDPVHHDPLLKPGAFIDPTPNPTSNGNGDGDGNGSGDRISIPDPVPNPTPQQSDPKTGSTGPVDVTDPANRPEWLPTGWLFKETLRTSGASAGSKDKYFIEPNTNHRFRSKKEVFSYLETGYTPKQQKRKNADSDIVTTPQQPKTETPKRKKVEAKAKDSMKNFNFDDVPAKVKWEMTDVFDGKWRPLINGVDRVPESSKQEWNAAFTYLTLQKGNRA